jgi:hypothetical protein
MNLDKLMSDNVKLITLFSHLDSFILGDVKTLSTHNNDISF